jgi:hypothetical protein
MGGVTQHIDSKETLERYYQEDTQFSCWDWKAIGEKLLAFLNGLQVISDH